MNKIINIILVLVTNFIFGQTKTPEEFGFRHIVFKYKDDPVDILIKSKKGEENFQKPLFFFCQGSLPKPLIKYHEDNVYGVFPFDTASLTEKYHMVIVSKPYIPVVADYKTLSPSFNYVDSLGAFPQEYAERNLLSYYVPRNSAFLKHLQKQKWVSTNQLVVAGHSEGSTIAAKMTVDYKKITHLIYAGGNPMGRIMSIIGQSRASETDTEQTRFGEEEIKYWEAVVKNKSDMNGAQGDTNKATFEFSNPPIKYIRKLKIPILVSYGSKDWSAPFNDLMRVEFIRKGKRNVTFQTYVGTEHNFFPVTVNNTPNYEIFNWDKVANDWLQWIKEK